MQGPFVQFVQRLRGLKEQRGETHHLARVRPILNQQAAAQTQFFSRRLRLLLPVQFFIGKQFLHLFAAFINLPCNTFPEREEANTQHSLAYPRRWGSRKSTPLELYHVRFILSYPALTE